MSLYHVQKVMFLMKKDGALAGKVKESAADALVDFPLAEEEKNALLFGDIALLYSMGVHPLLLAPYSRIMGITRPEYSERLSPLIGQRTLHSQFGEEQ
ncbi:MAG: hypothetical protein CL536_05835 [Alcaligenaceae bacterium]|nr:hypothetical protein [Alcaligenaceae bacterium]